MPVEKRAIDECFVFDDYYRRCSQRLFDESLSQARQQRNRVYREGLLLILSGLGEENGFEITEGIDLIAEVFTARKPFVPVAEIPDDE